MEPDRPAAYLLAQLRGQLIDLLLQSINAGLPVGGGGEWD